MNKKIIMSLSVIAAVAAVVIGGTKAFFSDTETSQGNTFTAGAIDLKVDSQQHYNNAICVDGHWALEPNKTADTPQYPVIGSDCGGTWALKDLAPTQDKFFNFGDIKPGDSGENTISLHVLNNDAYVCATVSNLHNDDLGLTEPEQSAPASDLTNGPGNGELQQNLVMTIWNDKGVMVDNQLIGKGDNIWQDGEPVLYEGSAQEGTWPLYDPAHGGALAAGDTGYIGVAWNLPFSTGNEVQTDSLTGDINFTVVQSRNNGEFRCSSLNPTPLWTDDGTRTGGNVSFVQNESRGTVLRVETTDENDSRVRWTNNHLNLDLATLTGISFEANRLSAIDSVNGDVSMRLFIDKDGNLLTADSEEITYEPYYNIAAYNPLNAASIQSNTWQTWSTTLANGKFWGNGGFLGTTPSGGAYATNVTLSQVSAAYPSAKIVGISLGMGTYNPGQVVLVDNLVINGSSVSLEN